MGASPDVLRRLFGEFDSSYAFDVKESQLAPAGKAFHLFWESKILDRRVGSLNEIDDLDPMIRILDPADVIAWFDNDSKTPQTVQDGMNELERLNLRQVNRMSDAIYKAIMCLIAVNGGRDFRNIDVLEFNTLDDHHIFPRSRADEFRAGNHINSIGNKTLIDKDTNEKYIRNARPHDYIERIITEQGISEADMKKRLGTHLIDSEAFDALFSNEFETFVSRREQTLKNLLHQLVSNPEH